MPISKTESAPRVRKRHKSVQASLDALARMPDIPSDLIDQFVTGPMSAEAVNVATYAFKRALIERALQAELTHHLGHEQGATPADGNNTEAVCRELDHS